MLVQLLLACAGSIPQSDVDDPHRWHPPGPVVEHVPLHFVVRADGVGSDSETGIGALIPWANRLWAIGYVAHVRGEGIGLYEIRDDLSWRLHPESITGTFANRFVHWRSKQVVIGPHVIDEQGHVRTIAPLASHRITATANHLSDPDSVYMLTMEGLLFETQLRSLETRQVANLTKELALPEGAYTHFKGMHTAQGRVVVANNSYDEAEHTKQRRAGRLAEWTGDGPWQILETNPFVEVAGKQNLGAGATYGNTIFALGWDHASPILRVCHAGVWKRYRLPQASHSFDHTWNTEWMRIREVQTERYVMDAFGMFYDLPALVYGGHVWGVRPLGTHVRIVPDFVHWRGLLVLAGDQTDNSVGQPQSGLWLGSLDDLASFGSPQGWGAVWREDRTEANVPSDPFLMTGFAEKGLHLWHDADQAVTFLVETDVLGDGAWKRYAEFTVAPRDAFHHEFPRAYGAHWVRVVANKSCTATAQFVYR
ncbi:MAG: hypothetical protein L6Q99_07770 [Planctomycetes bacterium]|nr:hypothetical protein [Planctomycetota bacterium]